MQFKKIKGTVNNQFLTLNIIKLYKSPINPSSQENDLANLFFQ